MAKTITTAADIDDIFEHYAVTLQVREKIFGGIPKSPEMIRGWLESRFGANDKTERLISKTEAEMQADIDSAEKESWTGFKADDQGLYIEGRQVKAMFKEAAGVLREQLGVTAFKARIAERVFVVENKVHLGKTEADDSIERPIHVMTAQGPKTALKKSDYVEKPLIAFTVKVLAQPLSRKGSDGKVKDLIMPCAYLPLLLKLGGELGIGADRSQSNGQFDVTGFSRQADPRLTIQAVPHRFQPNLCDVPLHYMSIQT